MYFKPKNEWNTTQPASVTDETGNFTFSLSAVWGDNAGVMPNGLYRSGTVNDIEMTNNDTFVLTDGFTIAAEFALNSLQSKTYLNRFAPAQLSWIYGYKSGKIEFYNYGASITAEIFRSGTERSLQDTNNHFISLSYDVVSGNCLFVYDDDVATFSVATGKMFRIQKSGEGITTCLKRDYNFDVGKFFVYPRGLSLNEVGVLKGLTSV